MVSIKNYLEFCNRLPENVTLVAVSKTRTKEEVMALYNEGHRHFGENKVQELIAKQELLPNDIQWHLIGHLQTNKVKYIAPFVSLIHSVDSFKVLKTINKEAAKNDRVIDCLLQFFIAEEDTKFGLDLEEANQILGSDEYGQLKNIKIKGVMGMATFTEDYEQVRREFKTLKSIFDALKQEFFTQDIDFKEISMGMSDDYQIAVEEGSTIVRIGSALFGERG
jgi:pyridoxal phosphate enzyme (YggS family)